MIIIFYSFSSFCAHGALLENENIGPIHGKNNTIFDGNSHLDNRLRVKKKLSNISTTHTDMHAQSNIIPV